MKHRLRVGVALLIVVSLQPQPAVALNFGSNTASGGTAAHACDTTTASQCVANNGVHVVSNSTLRNGWDTAVGYAISIYDADPSIIVGWGSPPDVYAGSWTFGINGLWGWTQCVANNETQYGGVKSDEVV